MNIHVPFSHYEYDQTFDTKVVIGNFDLIHTRDTSLIIRETPGNER